MHEDGTAGLLVDLVKMEGQHWLMWHDGVWETDEFLEAVEEELRQREMRYYRGGTLGLDDEDSIDTLMLPQYILNALHRDGIETIEDLEKKTDAELLKLKRIGKRSIELIHEALEYETSSGSE